VHLPVNTGHQISDKMHSYTIQTLYTHYLRRQARTLPPHRNLICKHTIYETNNLPITFSSTTPLHSFSWSVTYKLTASNTTPS